MSLKKKENISADLQPLTPLCNFTGREQQNIGQQEFYQFPRLAELELLDDDLLAYCEHVEVLKEDMIKGFTDLRT